MDVHVGINLNMPNILEYDDERIEQLEKEKEFNDCLDTFHRCGIGKEYYNYDLYSFNTDMRIQEEMKQKAREFYKNILTGKKTNMLITGNAGTGKTHLVVGLLRQFCFQKKIVKLNGYNIEGHYTVRYISSKDLCDLYRKTQIFGSDYTIYSFYRDFTRSYDILVIDELGKSTDKFEWEILFDVLDKRMQEGKSSILVSNLSYDNVNKNLGDYGMSRMNINGNLVKIDTTGVPDYRQK